MWIHFLTKLGHKCLEILPLVAFYQLSFALSLQVTLLNNNCLHFSSCNLKSKSSCLQVGLRIEHPQELINSIQVRPFSLFWSSSFWMTLSSVLTIIFSQIRKRVVYHFIKRRNCNFTFITCMIFDVQGYFRMRKIKAKANYARFRVLTCFWVIC